MPFFFRLAWPEGNQERVILNGLIGLDVDEKYGKYTQGKQTSPRPEPKPPREKGGRAPENLPASSLPVCRVAGATELGGPVGSKTGGINGVSEHIFVSA